MSAPFGDLGPCAVYLDDVDLGENHNVHVKPSEDVAGHFTAKGGTKAENETFTGSGVEVTIEFTESTVAQMAACYPNASVDGNELMIANAVGLDARSIAGTLVIKPIVSGVATVDATKWITIFVCAPIPNQDIVFDAATDRGYAVTFRAYKVITVPSGETYEVGDLWAVGYGETA